MGPRGEWPSSHVYWKPFFGADVLKGTMKSVSSQTSETCLFLTFAHCSCFCRRKKKVVASETQIMCVVSEWEKNVICTGHTQSADINGGSSSGRMEQYAWRTLDCQNIEQRGSGWWYTAGGDWEQRITSKDRPLYPYVDCQTLQSKRFLLMLWTIKPDIFIQNTCF